MKKIQFMIIALLTLVSNAMAGGKHVYNSSASGCTCTLEAVYNEPDNNGSSNIEISLSSPDAHEYFAFQMFIVLNEGVTLTPDADEDYGEYVVIPSDRFGNTDKKKAKYGIQIAKKGNGYQLVCLHQRGDSILEYNGLLLTIPVKNVPRGKDIIGEINEIEFTTQEGKAVRFEPENISLITTVGINSTNKEKQQSKVYNLRGQEINDTSKGLIIKNRKKIVNK